MKIVKPSFRFWVVFGLLGAIWAQGPVAFEAPGVAAPSAESPRVSADGRVEGPEKKKSSPADRMKQKIKKVFGYAKRPINSMFLSKLNEGDMRTAGMPSLLSAASMYSLAGVLSHRKARKLRQMIQVRDGLSQLNVRQRFLHDDLRSTFNQLTSALRKIDMTEDKLTHELDYSEKRFTV